MFFIIFSSFAIFFATAEDADECSRFSPREFDVSVFQPVVASRLAFLESVLEDALAGVEETMVGLEEKKTNSKLIDTQAVRQKVANMHQVTSLIMKQAGINIDQGMERLLQVGEDEPILDELERLMVTLREVENGIKIPFTDLAESMKTFVAPMLKVMEMFVNAESDKKADIWNKIQENDKLLGKVLGKILFSKLDNKKLEEANFLGKALSIVENIIENVDHESKAGDASLWKNILESAWKSRSTNSDDDKIDFLASLVSHTGLEVGADFFKNLIPPKQ